MNKLLAGLIISLTVLLLASCVEPKRGPLPQAKPKPHKVIPSADNSVTAINPNTYSAAYKRFYARAMAGDPVAQSNLGQMYFDGRGVPVDHGLAIQWFSKAASKKNTEAQLYLGVAYWYGRGVAQDSTRACSYFQQAKRQGSREGSDFYQRHCSG